MLLAKVRGNVVATQKDPNLLGHKLLVIRTIDLEGNFLGINDIIAIDLTGSGIGDTVLVTQEGDAVAQILGHRNAPVHTIIVAIVDQVSVNI
ncbi:MAG: EutN/CcmL family microcompartment protein [Ignavibacteriales bacterium]|nr:EutN/CcmL family microcompartment protein [Ignavibacteriales bacterium]